MATKFEKDRQYQRVGAGKTLDSELWRCDFAGKTYAVLTNMQTGKETAQQHDWAGWRPAPRVVERWIVLTHSDSYSFPCQGEADSFAAQFKYGTATVNGPFPCEAP